MDGTEFEYHIPNLKNPKGERTWVSYYNKEGNLVFVMTSKENSRDWYFLYRVEDGKMIKLGKARTPPELEERYQVDEAIRGPQPQQKKSRRKKKEPEETTK